MHFKIYLKIMSLKQKTKNDIVLHTNTFIKSIRELTGCECKNIKTGIEPICVFGKLNEIASTQM